MSEQIEQIILYLHELENKIDERAQLIRSKNPNSEIEKELIHMLGTEQMNYKICAVDSGLLAREAQGYDVVLTKTVGVSFVYQYSKLVSCKHHPSIAPETKLHVSHSLDEHEVLISRNLIRLNEEIENAIELVDKFSPDIVMIDGSLVPLPNDRPDEKSLLFENYKKTIENYKKLFAKNVMVIGVTKDTRSKRFAHEFGVEFCGDIGLMHHMLNENERTFAMTYSEKKTPVLKDLEAKIYFFYMRPLGDDTPIRVEFLTKEFDKVATIVQSLSKISRSYAYPAVLIEADLRAALNPIEMEKLDKLNLRPLRRNSRPFR
ncbi:MAG: DNA double-strand break repair nuclease NurA [Candidatus Micrarchaeota archaeon]